MNFLSSLGTGTNSFSRLIEIFYAANNTHREVLTAGQAHDKSLFCIFSYSMAKSALFIHGILVFIAT